MSVVLSQDLLLCWLQQLKHVLLICCKLLRKLKVCKQNKVLLINLLLVNNFFFFKKKVIHSTYYALLLQPNVSTDAKKISIYLNMVGLRMSNITKIIN